MDKRILLVTEQINSEIKAPLDVKELATKINVSPSRLRQLFKTEIGLPLGEYTRQQQLEHACELLKTTFMRIHEIGTALGFQDQSYFNRVFKEKYGLTPKEFRNENHIEFARISKKLPKKTNRQRAQNSSGQASR